MRKFLLILVLATSTVVFAQNKWRAGYYISDSGQRIDGEIYDKQWRANPTDFSFRPNESSSEIVITLANAMEFSIPGNCKFVRETFEMERSSKEASLLQRSKVPVFNTETQFLRILVEGKYTLYYYNAESIWKFLYKGIDGKVVQLIHISYLGGPDMIDVMTNSQFKNQLWNAVKCDDTKLADVEKLKYEKASLTNYFHQVNSCGNTSGVAFEEKVKKGKFNVRLLAGISPSKMKLEGPPSTAFDANSTMPTVGVELEYLLPTNNSKWALFLEANYNMFSTTADTPNGNSVDITYNFIQIPIGIRHYFFLNKQNRLFLNAVASANVVTSSAFDYKTGRDYEGQADVINFGFGAGYEFNRISAELRYYSKVSPLSRLENSLTRFSAVVKFRVL